MTHAIDALFIDLDATILDENYLVAASLAACLQIVRAHPELDARELARANVEVFMSYWPVAEDAWILGNLSSDEFRAETWRRTFHRFGITDETVIAESVALHYQVELGEYRAFDDVMATLDSASAAGIMTAVISNGPSDTQREKLALLEIADRVDAIVLSGEVGVAKPDPRIFEHALTELGVSADVAIHVGDSLASDVGGALAAGVTAVWLNRDGRERAASDPEPDLEIRSLRELIPLWTR